MYYLPFHLEEGRAVQASGLIHNRLIHVRRKLRCGDNRKRRRSSEGNSSEGGESTGSSKKLTKPNREKSRLRPLPVSFEHQPPAINDDLDDQVEECLEWLKFSSPVFLVEEKWKRTFQERKQILTEKELNGYIDLFPALQAPWGYKLVSME